MQVANSADKGRVSTAISVDPAGKRISIAQSGALEILAFNCDAGRKGLSSGKNNQRMGRPVSF